MSLSIAEIQAYIRADAQRQARLKKLFEYYRGRHAIAGRVLADTSKPNNKLQHGFPYMIANNFVGYLFGEPAAYTAEDDALAQRVAACFEYNDEASHNARLGLDLAICGAAVEILYMDADGMERFARVDPVGCTPVTDHTIEDNLVALIRAYDVADVAHNTLMGTVEVYDAETVATYEAPGGVQGGAGVLRLIAEEPHFFGDVPAVVYRNNPDAMGDFEGVLSLIDAYDLMQSESLNDQEYFTDAYLKLKGIGEIDPEAMAQMKRNRVLLLPEDADADWMIKTQSDALPENIKNRLNADILRFSGCPDMTDESFAGNASGVAIRYKLLAFENLTGQKEREFKRGLQRRLELLTNLWRVKDGAAWDWRSVQISFKRALPQNLLELSQVMGNLGDLYSDETKRSILPLDVDEEEEKARLEEQRQGSVFTPWELAHGRLTEEQGDGEA